MISLKWYVAATMYAVYGSLFAIVFMRLTSGVIRTTGLLSAEGQAAPSPERAQLLVGSLFAMAAYGFQTVGEFQGVVRAQASGGVPTMPEPSVWLVAALAGNNALYLVGKVTRLFTGRT